MDTIIKVEPIEFESDDDNTPLSSFKKSIREKVFETKDEIDEDFANIKPYADDVEIKTEINNLDQSYQYKEILENSPTKNHYLRELFKDEIDEFAFITTATNDSENEEVHIKIENDNEETDDLSTEVFKDTICDKYQIRIVNGNNVYDIGDVNQSRGKNTENRETEIEIDEYFANIKPYADDIEIKSEIRNLHDNANETDSTNSKCPSKKSILDTCQYCNQLFTQKFLFFEHLRNIHIICHICRKTFTSERYLRIHLNFCSSKKSTQVLKCSYCFRLFLNEEFLQTHINEIHLKIKNQSLNCTFCQKLCSNHNDLKIHINVVHFKKKGDVLMCQYCGKFCINDYSLKQHTNSVHLKIKKPVLKCKLYPKRFPTNLRLDAHMRAFNNVDL